MKHILLLSLMVPALGAAPANRDNALIVPSLKGLVFIANAQDLQKSGSAANGISLEAVPLLNQPAFQQQVSSYLGQPLSFKGLKEITSKVSAFYKQANHPLVDVVAPEQDVSSGVVQIVVTEFRVGQIEVQGNRWFSDNVVSAPITFQHGDTIDSQQLLNQLNAANANPFRRVDMVYRPSAQPGYTDLILNTQDRFPLTAYSGFDNSGTAITGRSRWNLGVTWGNALWHDQQLSYQFSSSDNFFTGSGPHGASYLSNSLNWSMPLRFHDSLSIFGSYQKSVPNIGTDFGFLGKSGQASIRYSLGLHRTSRFVQTLQFGYDFKTTNNNLAFGGTQVSRTSAEIDQFPVTYAANLTDSHGASSLSTSLVYSPGQITPDNSSSAFQPGQGQTGIPGASAHYVYWRTDFNRLNNLPKNAVYSFRLLGQTSNANLLYTEKLSGGGPGLLRGYDPNSVYGDRGILMSNELRTPAISPGREYGLGTAQLYVFWDYGHLTSAHTISNSVNSVSASSVGVGLRYNLRSNFTSHADYGRALIQLPYENAGARNSFVSLSLVVAY